MLTSTDHWPNVCVLFVSKFSSMKQFLKLQIGLQIGLQIFKNLQIGWRVPEKSTWICHYRPLTIDQHYNRHF